MLDYILLNPLVLYHNMFGIEEPNTNSTMILGCKTIG